MKLLDKIFSSLGYIRIPAITTPLGVAISESAQKDLDFLFRETRFTAFKVDSQFHFNAKFDLSKNPEGTKIEAILNKYARCGFVFMSNDGKLLGNICSITTPEERAENRRANFRIVEDKV
jgi:hypothetical protein